MGGSAVEMQTEVKSLRVITTQQLRIVLFDGADLTFTVMAYTVKFHTVQKINRNKWMAGSVTNTLKFLKRLCFQNA